MAEQVSIKDQESAIKWLMTVQALNEDYHVAMQEAAETLKSMGDFAEGTIVDDFVNFGTNLLNAAETTFKAIDSIADTVKSVLSTVDKFKEGVKDAFSSVVRKILN